MATLLLSVAGTSVAGTAFGSSSALAATFGGYVGSQIGSYIDHSLFRDGVTTQQNIPPVPIKDIQTSNYGKTIPRVFGSMLVAGNLLWTGEILTRGVIANNNLSPGDQYGPIAISICEGEIDSIEAIYADGVPINMRDDPITGDIVVYTGTETQNVDPTMNSENVGKTPAYRGMAYVVLKVWDYTRWGGIPNFTFKVVKKRITTTGQYVSDAEYVTIGPNLEDVSLDPYNIIYSEINATDHIYNGHLTDGNPDFVTSYEGLRLAFPSLLGVNIEYPVFMDHSSGQLRLLSQGDNTAMGWTISYPAQQVTGANILRRKVGDPEMWNYGGTKEPGYSIGGTTTFNDTSGTATINTRMATDYGGFVGSPDIKSLIRVVYYLITKGLDVQITPVIRIYGHPTLKFPYIWDVPNYTTSQHTTFLNATTHTGLLFGNSDTGFVDSRGTQAIQEMVSLRGSKLSDTAGMPTSAQVISAPVNYIGLMRILIQVFETFHTDYNTVYGLPTDTTVATTMSQFHSNFRMHWGAGMLQFLDLPANETLITTELTSIRQFATQIVLGYALYWNEAYWPGRTTYKIDKIAGHATIGFLGFIAGYPITPRLDQDNITQAIVKQYWEAGEGWDYYYNSSGTQVTIGNYPTQRYKNLYGWWAETRTDYTPKPLVIMNVAFPSIDGCTNDPSITTAYYGKNGLPVGSKGLFSIAAQYTALNGSLDYWRKNFGDAQFATKVYIGNWDSRPYPALVENQVIWPDGQYWNGSNALNGKDNNALIHNVALYIEQTLNTLYPGVNQYFSSQVPVDSQYNGGLIFTSPYTCADIVKTLNNVFPMTCVQSGNQLVLRDFSSSTPISVPTGDMREPLTSKVDTDVHMPHALTFTYISENYDYNTVNAFRADSTEKSTMNVTIDALLSERQAEVVARVLLHGAWDARHSIEFIVGPQYLALESGDLINVQSVGTKISRFIITSVNIQKDGSLQVIAARSDANIYANAVSALHNVFQVIRTSTPVIHAASNAAYVQPLDVAGVTGINLSSITKIGLVVIPYGSWWSGTRFALQSAVNTHVFADVRQATSGGTFRIDGVDIYVKMFHGTPIPASVPGPITTTSYKALIGSEIISYGGATLLGNEYKLLNVSRGTAGGGSIFIQLQTVPFFELEKEHVNQSITWYYYHDAEAGAIFRPDDTFGQTYSTTITYQGRNITP